ncbi:MAG: site-specific integrase [Nannocystis sp.]|nr:site-specific integrase [Nannocystis sp.]
MAERAARALGAVPALKTHQTQSSAAHAGFDHLHAQSSAGRAGLASSGLHLLRHTALTRLSRLGASIYLVQAVARHSRLQTTAGYLHAQQLTLARGAADLLDFAAKARVGEAATGSAPSSDPPPHLDVHLGQPPSPARGSAG